MAGYSEILSTVAIVLSLGSFAISARGAFLDRPRLKIKSTFYDGSGFNENPSIYVEVVNAGRRPVILRTIGGYDKHGSFGGTLIDHEKGGRRLGEHERYEYTVYQHDAVFIDVDGPDDPYERLAIEDSLGNRYVVPNSREHIPLLFPAKG